MSQRKTREEWQRILEDQKTRGLSDVVCAQEQGVSISQLKRWRSLVGGRKTDKPVLVEITPSPSATKDLTIILRRSASIEIPISWPVSKIAQLIRELGVV